MVGNGKDLERMNRRMFVWMVRHPWLSTTLWVAGLLIFAGGYLSMGVVLQLPEVLEASAPQSVASAWAQPHIEKCVAEVEQGVSEAKAEEALKCAASVVEITSLGHRAMATLEDNPLVIIKAHMLYRGSHEWAEVLRLGDHRIAPVLRKCLEGGGDPLFDANSSLGTSIRGFFQGKAPSFDHLPPEKCGWYVVQLIAKAGTDFLSQFAVKDGEAHRLPLRTIGAALLSGVLGATVGVEKKLVLKEEIPVSQWAWAAAEVGTLGFFTAKLMVAKAAVAAAGTKVAATGVASGFAAGALKVGVTAVVLPVAKYAVVGGIAYYAITSPVNFTKQLGKVGEIFGVSPLTLQIAGWSFTVLLVIGTFGWIVMPVLLWLSARWSRKTRTVQI